MRQAEKLIISSKYIGLCWVFVETETASAVSLGKSTAEYSEESRHSSLAAGRRGQLLFLQGSTAGDWGRKLVEEEGIAPWRGTTYFNVWSVI